jgi:hypothetical protein
MQAMMFTRHDSGARRTVWTGLALVAVLAASAPARGGGGPENVLLVVNPTSVDSLAIANAYVELRGIQPLNVLLLPCMGDYEGTRIDRFRVEILLPVLRTIEARGLTPQIDYVVYSSGFPWRIDFAAELPAELAKLPALQFPSGSLTGMTMLFNAVQSGQPAWLDVESNDYFRPLGADGAPPTTVGFRSWYGWSDRGDLLEAGGSRYLLSTMLGVTAGRGNTVPEIVAALRSAAAADGSRPPGTLYFMTNTDLRTKARFNPVKGTMKALRTAGVKAEIVPGVLPVGRRDVAGLMTGAPDFDWPGSGCRLLPGAICDNLTSFGGVFTPGAAQTPLSHFIRAGAAGACGTVAEPFVMIPNGDAGTLPQAHQAKFPHPALLLHYARGASLAEAFYQSVHSPYQLLVVGDPLCQPWALAPEVDILDAATGTPLAAGAPLSGSLELEPRVTVAKDGKADRFELFIDGARVAQCGLGQRLPLDTAAFADGHHDLRLVAIEAGPVETQGRRVVPVRFANHARTLTLTVEPRRARPQGTLRVGVAGTGITGALIHAAGRVLGRTSTAESTIEVPAELLGRGTVTIRATGRSGPSPAEAVNAEPVTVQIGD